MFQQGVPSVWFLVLSGIWRTWDCSYLGALREFWMFWLVLVGNVPQLQQLVPELHPSSQATIYTDCTSYSTVPLACPNLTLSSSLRLKVQLAVPPWAPAMSLGSVLPLCCSLLQSASHGARAFGAHCQFWLWQFSPFPISDPTQLSLCPYRWLLLTPVLNLALNFFFWTHP